jgi:hypothetical protein
MTCISSEGTVMPMWFIIIVTALLVVEYRGMGTEMGVSWMAIVERLRRA